MAGKKHTKDLTTGVGTFSFPRIFPDTKGTKDDGTPSYDIQILIPKKVDGKPNPAVRDILLAIKEVGEAAYGPNWKKMRHPLRDGDKEADTKFAEDGTSYREKYPERLGCIFLNARSKRPVPVVARDRSLITDSDQVYGGAKGKISITMYPYASNGNTGIGAGLNGVQKIADGESFGGGGPAVENMFEILEGEGDDESGLDDFDVEDEPEEPKAKKAAPTAKKAKGKKGKPAPKEDDEDEIGLDDLGDDDDSDAFDALDDSDV